MKHDNSILIDELRDMLRRDIQEHEALLADNPSKRDAKRFRGNLTVMRNMLAEQDTKHFLAFFGIQS
jgi:hypothetical protein